MSFFLQSCWSQRRPMCFMPCAPLPITTLCFANDTKITEELPARPGVYGDASNSTWAAIDFVLVAIKHRRFTCGDFALRWSIKIELKEGASWHGKLLTLKRPVDSSFDHFISDAVSIHVDHLKELKLKEHGGKLQYTVIQSTASRSQGWCRVIQRFM